MAKHLPKRGGQSDVGGKASARATTMAKHLPKKSDRGKVSATKKSNDCSAKRSTLEAHTGTTQTRDNSGERSGKWGRGTTTGVLQQSLQKVE